MLNLILFVLVTYGLTQILVMGSILNFIRPKHHFFHCSQCMGFWAGICVYVAFWFAGINLFNNFIIGIPCFGFIGSGCSYILNRLVNDDGFNIHHN